MVNLTSAVNYFRLTRKHCTNWPEVLYDSSLGRPVRGKLNSGEVITLGRYDFYNLLILLESGWRVKENDELTMTLCKDVCLKVRTTRGLDLVHLVEIFRDRVYGDTFTGTVIDVGASNGDSSIYFALRGARTVIALEPMDESYKLAEENIEMNGLRGRVLLMKSALAGEDGVADLLVSTKSPNANSISPARHIAESTTFDRKEKVEAVTLRRIFVENAVDRVELLKMDCEGCEYEVTRKSVEELKVIDKIYMEYHDGPRDPEVSWVRGDGK
ncbi:hypothetical protein HS1genome_1863 [Sulfodiicoccus acidiphilus]|uniref:Methyltransferase FkbM domain-containing protein n=1 Tax=Sulfodiicoccus acidiphilus TaxID=1670455 RepID=A0A348B5M2_9CREN|nr:FkbM family methyltransferase [Sulfodiicoccus acidiphilus]BBD73474.1 hypothetical protein HS1genome_1863 [Sulfodiicoccus acidiphilus]GGT92875.1 hypothetical protein GCM10007116_08340 [Sulfodiicoccus acidiphilus]